MSKIKKLLEQIKESEELIKQFDSLISCNKNMIETLKKQVEQLQYEELKDFEIKCHYFINSVGDGISLPMKFIEFFSNRNTYNVFETKKEAEEQSKIINEYLKLYHVAKFLNNGWEPNWNNFNAKKFYIYYDYTTHNYHIAERNKDMINTVVYFRSKELAEKAKKYMEWDR